MTRRRASFTETDAIRAGKAAEKLGLCITGMEFRPDGSILVYCGAPLDKNKDAGTRIDAIIAKMRGENGTRRHGH